MKKNIKLYSPQWHEELKKETLWIFLAGPCQGSPQWQEDVMTDFPELGVTLCNPRRDSMGDGPEYYSEQLIWETEHLNACDIIMFWFPLKENDVTGRDYGQTTRVELGEWIEKSRTCKKPIFIGIDPNISGQRYFEEKCKEYSIPFFDNYTDLLNAVIEKATKLLSSNKTCYTSDTHFSSERALELSKRPFKNTLDMDRTLIRNWNSIVAPNDNVDHLGDFGNPEVLKYLNGKIHIIPGNYENEESLKELEKRGVIIYPKQLYGSINNIHFSMAHTPVDSKSLEADFHLFGHIHGRQTVKNWPGLDVGVDGHNYFPITEEDIKFWYTAITKYYDNNVFL